MVRSCLLSSAKDIEASNNTTIPRSFVVITREHTREIAPMARTRTKGRNHKRHKEHSAAKPQPKRTYRRDAENSEFFLSVCQPEFLNQVCSRVASARVCIGALQRRQRTQRKSSRNNKKFGASSTKTTRVLIFSCAYCNNNAEFLVFL